jgi:hypothetical protein
VAGLTAVVTMAGLFSSICVTAKALFKSFLTQIPKSISALLTVFVASTSCVFEVVFALALVQR